MPLVLGVDSSTQSCKVELRDADTGERLAAASAPHPATAPPACEQDPSAWWGALAGAAQDALTAREIRHVDAMAVGAQQHGAVVVDAAGDVVRPARLWNDTTSAPQADRLVRALGAEAWADRCGSVPVASFTITKLAWLAEHEPSTLARAAHVLLPHDWLTWRLTRRAVTDRGDASGTGYWSPADGGWDTGLLALIDDGIDWAARLPEVLDAHAAAGSLSSRAAAELGLRGDPLVAAGTGDNMAAALGVALRPGDVLISLGTSGTASTVTDASNHDASGVVAGFADATGRFLPLVCTLNATAASAHVARWLDVDLATLDQLALAADAGAGGVTFLPYLDGERTPNRPDATAVLAGVTSATTRADLARAAIEGVVCGLLDGVDALAAVTGADVSNGRIIVVGGGARSAAYPLVIAGMTGRPVELPVNPEAAALGACVQAAAVLHGCSLADVSAAWGLVGETAATIVEPTANIAERATEVRQRYADRRDREG
jgi:xylulokinase